MRITQLMREDSDYMAGMLVWHAWVAQACGSAEYALLRRVMIAIERDQETRLRQRGW
jgi:hypothetical protein